MVRFGHNIHEDDEEEEEETYDNKNSSLVFYDPTRTTTTTTLNPPPPRDWNEINEDQFLRALHAMRRYYDMNDTHDDFDKPRSWTWKKAIFVVLFAWILHHWQDFSSAPPVYVEDDSWLYHRTFWMTWSRIRSDMFRLAKRDVFYLTNSLKTTQQQPDPRSYCPLSLPNSTSFNLSSSSQSITESWLSNSIVGQDNALSQIASALEGRSVSSTHRNKPIGILFSGQDGVGKMTTALALSRLVVSSCSQSSVNDHHVLLLRGDQFASSSNEVGRTLMSSQEHHVLEALKHDFLKQIIQHILSQQKQGGGSVIILESIEKLHPALVMSLTGAFDGSHRLKYTDYNVEKGTTMEVEVDCSEVLFVLLTDVGADRIIKDVWRYGGRKKVPRKVLEGDVRDALDLFYDGSFLLEKMMDSIVPFLPLSNTDLEQILHRKLQSLSHEHQNRYWKQLEVTDAARHFLIGTDYVEYVDLRTNAKTMLFAKRGATDLERGGPMQMVRAMIGRYFVPYRTDRVAVIDYEEGRGEVVLSWCGEDDQRVIDGMCERVWRGPLD